MDEEKVVVNPSIPDELLANREFQDSVFRNIFSEKEYMFQMYQALHPEDTKTTIDELEYVTLEKVLVRDLYNDLGILVGERLLILVEAQSTLTENFIIRCLMYLMRTYQEYFKKTKQSLYSTTKVHLPVPELYVIYTGNDEVEHEIISLSDAFFEGKPVAIDAKVKFITDGKEGDIINQYVIFTRVMKDQIKIHGRTRKAVAETIRICKDRNVLREYLERREKEVIDIMITLFDQREIMEDFIASERREERESLAKATALRLHKKHFSVEEIADIVGYNTSTIERWIGLVPQV